MPISVGLISYLGGLVILAIIYFVFVFPYVYALHKLLYKYHLINFCTTLLTAFCLTLFWVSLLTMELPPEFSVLLKSNIVTQTFAISYWLLLLFWIHLYSKKQLN